MKIKMHERIRDFIHHMHAAGVPLEEIQDAILAVADREAMTWAPAYLARKKDGIPG